MIDVVILLTEKNNNLNKILASLAFQTNKDFKVVIIDSTKEGSYKKSVELFKEKLNIDYEITDEKVFKELMKIGIKKCTSKYIMFINEFDVLYDLYSIKYLSKDINDELIVEGRVVDKEEKDINNTIYGKIINQEFLNKNVDILDNIFDLNNKNNILCRFSLDNKKEIREIIYMKLK